MDEKKLAHAREAYATICRALDDRDWTYTKEEEKLFVHFGVNGEDDPIHFVILVDADRQLIRVLSRLPFQMSEAKRIDGAIAVCAASDSLPDGYFDYDLSKGTIIFRLVTSIEECTVGVGLIQYLIDCTCVVVDNYNDQFHAIEKGELSITDFLKNMQH